MKHLPCLLAIAWMATACGPDEPTCPTKACEDFQYQQEAQAVFDGDPDCYPHMDTNNDGIACEGLPRQGNP